MTTVFILGDTGKVIQVSVSIDITGANPVELVVQKPDGLEYTWTAAIYQNNPGIIQYQTVAGDLDQVGTYFIHARITDASGNIHTGAMASFMVASKYSAVCETQLESVC